MFRTIFHLRSPQSFNSILNPINPSSSSSSSPNPTIIIRSLLPPFSSYFSTTPILHRKQVDQNDDEFNRDPDDPPKLFVIQPRIRPETLLKSKLEEALNLANSLEQQRPDGFYATEFSDKEMPPHLVVQNPVAKSVKADTYFGVGTVSTVKCHINHLESEDEVDAIFVNAILTGVQQRNLERAWDKPVLDRVGLIIEIFNAHAQTKEAKLQAELAALMYKRSRLVRVRGLDGRYTFGESAEVVSARGRGSGGRGFISGAGETELQLQRRRILERRKKLLSEIKEVRRTRAMQRVARRRQGSSPGQEIATVAVVGYTNAGKSTLVSALSNSYLYCDDRLFATVDPKISSVILPSGRKVLLSDTVGFISDLPIQLVEAFHATLEEVVEADLLVHVLDSSAPDINEHRETVMQVLGRIGVSEDKIGNMIEVWNKVDLQEKKLDDNSEEGKIDDDSEEDEETRSDQDENDIEGEASSSSSGDVEQVDYSDEWLSMGEDEQDPPSPWETVKSNESSVAVVKDSQSKSEYVRTSAVTGVGLQELLDLIDHKLPTSQLLVQTDRKWRPPPRTAQDSSN